MKTFIPIVTVAAALSLFGNIALHGQSVAPPEDQVELAKAQTEAQKAQVEGQQQLAEVQSQTAQAQAQAEQDSGPWQQGSAYDQNGFRLAQVFSGQPGNPSRTLIVRSSEHDPKEQANLEEDLAVMTRIFEKAIAGKPGDELQTRTAMGINVYFPSDTSPLRNVYLDGYGALFMMNVNYPLLAPPAKSQEEKEKPSGDSAWQEARRELYGQAADGNPPPSAGEEYSAEKVNNLKNALLEALKDGTNIRNLKPDDSITVCVFGGASAHSGRFKEQARYQIAAQGDMSLTGKRISRDGAAAHGTIMTIRVKKADVDDFAKGKVNLDEFRKRASMTIYAVDAGKK